MRGVSSGRGITAWVALIGACLGGLIAVSGVSAAITFENEWTVGGKAKDVGIWDMTAGKDGSLFVLDGPDAKVTRFSPVGEPLRSWAVGSKTAVAITTDNEGNVLVTALDRILRFTADGGKLAGWKFGEKLKRDAWLLFEPGATAVASNGEVYILDMLSRVIRLSSDGRYLGSFGGIDAKHGGIYMPEDIAVGADGRVVVSQAIENHLSVFGPKGKYLGRVGERGSAPGRFLAASNVATDAQGRIAVTDVLLNRVQILDGSGRYLDQIGSQGFGSSRFSGIGEVAFSDSGDLYVADRGGKRIQRFTVDTEIPRLPQAQLYFRVGKSFIASKLPGKKIALDVPVRNFGDVAATGISICPDKSNKFTRKVFGKSRCLKPGAIQPGSTVELTMRGRIPAKQRKGRLHVTRFTLKSENAGGGPFGSMIYTGRRFNWLDGYKLPNDAQSVAMRLRARGAPGN